MAVCIVMCIHVFASQNVRLVNDVQTTFLQLQAECEKLNESNTCLHEDNRRKQSHIEVDGQTRFSMFSCCFYFRNYVLFHLDSQLLPDDVVTCQNIINLQRLGLKKA